MTVTFNKFNSFVAALANKTHNLGSDQLKIALTDAAPSASNTQLSNITEISYTSLSSRNITTTSSSQTGGVYKLILQNLVMTSSGTVGPFRYVVLYNDSATNKELIGWYDIGVETTLLNTDTLTLNFDGTNGAVSIT
ncbi:MAG: hypothetical protein KGL39_37925 [Patescibacteria group bacterium]|nr:hypothetical protein [Patescibacteria group bacterium]